MAQKDERMLSGFASPSRWTSPLALVCGVILIANLVTSGYAEGEVVSKYCPFIFLGTFQVVTDPSHRQD